MRGSSTDAPHLSHLHLATTNMTKSKSKKRQRRSSQSSSDEDTTTMSKLKNPPGRPSPFHDDEKATMMLWRDEFFNKKKASDKFDTKEWFLRKFAEFGQEYDRLDDTTTPSGGSWYDVSCFHYRLFIYR